MSDSEDDKLLVEIKDNNEGSSRKKITERTKHLYQKSYNHFLEWQKKENVSSLSESVLLAYFQDMRKQYSPPTLFARFSMLKSTLKTCKKFDISKYYKLRTFIKKTSEGYTTKKSKIFTPSEIKDFIENAPDSYIVIKVAVIFGVTGACQKTELYGLLFENVTDFDGKLLVSIVKNNNDIDRTFTIAGTHYDLVKKYMGKRPKKCANNHFFLKYYKGKCTNQNVGKNAFGNMGKEVATYLKLENPELYTGHCFRRTSATVLISSGGDIMPLGNPRVKTNSIVLPPPDFMLNKLNESSAPPSNSQTTRTYSIGSSGDDSDSSGRQ